MSIAKQSERGGGWYPITFRCTAELKRRLRVRAAEEGISAPELTRRAVEAYLARRRAAAEGPAGQAVTTG